MSEEHSAMHTYVTRRSWLLAEFVTGYLALAIGLSSWLVPHTPLRGLLDGTGEARSFILGFCAIGLLMCAATIRGALLLRRFPDSGHPEFVRLAKWRRWLHSGLVVLWSAVLVIMLFFAESKAWLLIMLAPVLMVFHVRGAWEHVKACKLGPLAERRSVLDLVRDSLGG